jgi:hypothetical protein
MATGPGTRAMISFDPYGKGLQRRIGKWPTDTNLLRQGCQPTGRMTGPPGFEQPEYRCPFPIVGKPVWDSRGQDWFSNKSVFDGFDNHTTGWLVGVVVVAAVAAMLWWPTRQKNPAEPSEDWTEAWQLIFDARKYARRGRRGRPHVRLRLDEALLHADRLPAGQRAVLHEAVQDLERQVY